MRFIKEWAPVWLGLLGMACGSAITAESMSSRVKENAYNGYHCAPITKHTSLESAKAQVLINQKLGERL